LGDALERELGVLHILFDGHPKGDGVGGMGLRGEWDAMLRGRKPQPLADEVRRRIGASGYSGAVISCPSGVMPAEDGQAAPWHFPRSLLEAMAAIGVRCAVLIGPHEACMDAAINREGSEVSVETWCRDNSNWNDFQPLRFPECVLEAFSAGKRRSVSDLVQEFQRRFLA
jgi:hypothetical protein